MTDEPPPPEMIEYLRRIGKKYGALGGQATAKKLSAAQRKRNASRAGKGNLDALTPAERRARASEAAKAMWAKKRAKKTKKPADK
jgi:hypothetical protein